jgi:hypothetical protein
MPESTWSEGVIARYLTKAAEILGDDITVDVVQNDGRTRAHCHGCGLEPTDEPDYLAAHAYKKAQEHAEKCRAMPRPTA